MNEAAPQPTLATGKPSPVLILFLIFPVLGLIAAVALALSNASTASTAYPTPLPVTLAVTTLINKPAANFELDGLDGGRYRLSSYRGKVVFLNFWATWCEPCQRELPAFSAFSQEAEGHDAVVLAVNQAETPDQINTYFEEKGIHDITVLLDTNLDVNTAYNIRGLPTTYVIDAEGVVRYLHIGEISVQDMRDYVDSFKIEAGA